MTTCFCLLILAGCVASPQEGKVHVSATETARLQSDQMKKVDEALVSQFKGIKTGMSPAQVRDIMGVEPEVIRDNLWHFKLSRASDTPEEIDWRLIVRFENGLVADTQITYTCLHREPRNDNCN